MGPGIGERICRQREYGWKAGVQNGRRREGESLLEERTPGYASRFAAFYPSGFVTRSAHQPAV